MRQQILVSLGFFACGLDASDGQEKAGLLQGIASFISADDQIQPSAVSLGDKKCPCIGFDNVGGHVKVSVQNNSLQYPADLGATCKAWDWQRHPLCDPPPAPWCAQQWCYVDPCNCDLPTLPKISAYLPKSKYQGKPVYYSYATCGGTDLYVSALHSEACVNQESEDACNAKSKCLWNPGEGKCGGKEVMGSCMKKLPEKKWGMDKCRCVGIDKKPGKTLVDVGGGKLVKYPAGTGASCAAWDQNRNPACKKDNPPAWCSDAWCYVDPCSCDLPDTPPKGSYYLPDAKFQGKQVFYSYATCGTKDQYSGSQLERAVKKQAEVCSAAK